MLVAPVARSGWSGGSALSMNLPMPSTLMRKPGLAPLGLPWSTSQEPSAAVVGSSTLSPHGPRTSSLALIGFLPRRLVNQLESATSSMLLTLALSPAGSTAQKRATGRNTMLSAPSHRNADS